MNKIPYHFGITLGNKDSQDRILTIIGGFIAEDESEAEIKFGNIVTSELENNPSYELVIAVHNKFYA